MTDLTADRIATEYDAYHCTQCAGTGERLNESREVVGQRPTVPCFCSGGTVLVLRGFTPPWYAGSTVEPLINRHSGRPEPQWVQKAEAR